MSARSAQNRSVIEFLTRPNFRLVSSQLCVALVTAIPFAAALELNRDDVLLAVVMRATRFKIDIYADDHDAVDFSSHAATRSRGQSSTSPEPIIQHTIIIAKPLLNEPLC